MKDYIYKEQLKLFGQREVIGFGEDGFNIKEIDRNLAKAIKWRLADDSTFIV